MPSVCVITGSRADAGMLEWPILKLSEAFDVEVFDVRHRSHTAWYAMRKSSERFRHDPPDLVLVLGDRYEIMAATMAAHLARIPIAHIGGGDVTMGSYDDAMRDCISRMATIHFATNENSASALRTNYQIYRESNFGRVHCVGSPGIDYILHANWKGERPHAINYVVVSYQAETANGRNEIREIIRGLPKDKLAVFIMPNPDRGSDDIRKAIRDHCECNPFALWHDELPHPDFLNLLSYCDEFIGNSSAIFYEAPTLGVKTRVVGNRQAGRHPIVGDGRASERMVKVLQEYFDANQV